MNRSKAEILAEMNSNENEVRRWKDTLKYYCWLDDQNLNWADIKAVRQLWYRDEKAGLSFKLKDNSFVSTPQPPEYCTEEIIFNRKPLEAV
jgi:hypothetical protein